METIYWYLIISKAEKQLNWTVRAFLLPSAARKHTILDVQWFLQSSLDPVFCACYVLSRSRFCVCLSRFRNSGEIIKASGRFYKWGGRSNFISCLAVILQFNTSNTNTSFIFTYSLLDLHTQWKRSTIFWINQVRMTLILSYSLINCGDIPWSHLYLHIFTYATLANHGAQAY
jgi:hypothetical protein